MTLLIVDDQSSVVRGIMEGVDWAADGFDTILTAYNAAEARALLQGHAVDVMLCDIEMPVESGISLVSWVRGAYPHTQCIFLTSQMSFEYAQQALRLGSVDYLVLPTPYPEIRQAVQRAVAGLERRSATDALREYALMMREREQDIVQSLLHRYLMTGDDQLLMRDWQALGKLPDDDTVCHLALVQVLRQEGGIEQWEPGLLRYALGNVIVEMFAGYGQRVISTVNENGIHCHLIFGEDYTMDAEGVIRQLDYLIRLGRDHLDCVLACYTGTVSIPQDAPALYRQLTERVQDNVALQSRVFGPAASTPPQANSFAGSALRSRWYQELSSGYTQAVRDDCIAYLDKQAASGTFDALGLQRFYQAYIQLLTQVLSARGFSLLELLDSPDAFDIYRSGDASMAHMQRLIHFTLDLVDGLLSTEEDSAFHVSQVADYVHDHLEEDIRRTDLAAHFHLNPDYLARVFKKETGQTLKEFITNEKIAVAKALLRTTSLPVGMIAAKVGYGSFSHFTKVYAKVTGKTPSEERQEAKQAETGRP